MVECYTDLAMCFDTDMHVAAPAILLERKPSGVRGTRSYTSLLRQSVEVVLVRVENDNVVVRNENDDYSVRR